MALVILSQQRKTLCSYPEGVMVTFGPKNMYFALDDSGLAKYNDLCSYSYSERSIGNLGTKN